MPIDVDWQTERTRNINAMRMRSHGARMMEVCVFALALGQGSRLMHVPNLSAGFVEMNGLCSRSEPVGKMCRLC